MNDLLKKIQQLFPILGVVAMATLLALAGRYFINLESRQEAAQENQSVLMKKVDSVLTEQRINDMEIKMIIGGTRDSLRALFLMSQHQSSDIRMIPGHVDQSLSELSQYQQRQFRAIMNEYLKAQAREKEYNIDTPKVKNLYKQIIQYNKP